LENFIVDDSKLSICKCLRAKKLASNVKTMDDLWNRLLEDDWEEFSEEYIKNISKEVLSEIKAAINLCEDDVSILFEILKDTLWCAGKILEEHYYLYEGTPGVQMLCDIAIELINKIDELLEFDFEICEDEKIQIYQFLAGFYDGQNTFNMNSGFVMLGMYIDEKYHDDEMVQKYLGKIEELDELEDNDRNWGYSQWIDNAVKDNDLEKAFELCDKVRDEIGLENAEYDVIKSMADAYMKGGEISLAIQYYNCIEEWYDIKKPLELAHCYRAIGEISNSIDKYYEFISGYEEIFEGDMEYINSQSWNVEPLLSSVVELTEICDFDHKEWWWKKIEKLLLKLPIDNYSYGDELNEIRLQYINYLQSHHRDDEANWQKLIYSKLALDSSDDKYEKAIEFLELLMNNQSNDFWERRLSVYACMIWVKNSNETSEEEKIQKCIEAIEKIDGNDLDCCFMQMYFYHYISENFKCNDDAMRAEEYHNKCDYIYMLEYATETFLWNTEKQCEEWRSLADDYELSCCYDKAEICYRRQFETAKLLSLDNVYYKVNVVGRIENIYKKSGSDYSMKITNDFLNLVFQKFILDEHNSYHTEYDREDICFYSLYEDHISFYGGRPGYDLYSCLSSLARDFSWKVNSDENNDVKNHIFANMAQKLYLLQCHQLILPLDGFSFEEQAKRLFELYQNFDVSKYKFIQMLKRNWEIEQILVDFLENEILSVCQKLLELEDFIDSDIKIACCNFVKEKCNQEIDFK